MPKVAAVPRHYSMTMNSQETGDLILALRIFCREFESTDDQEAILAELEDKYEGELGQPPGEPLEEVA